MISDPRASQPQDQDQAEQPRHDDENASAPPLNTLAAIAEPGAQPYQLQAMAGNACSLMSVVAVPTAVTLPAHTIETGEPDTAALEAAAGSHADIRQRDTPSEA